MRWPDTSGRSDGAGQELELGAVLMALRMKGESIDEVAGALAALQGRVRPVPVDPSRPVVSIPSYNGARREANLTALLASLLADAGIQVIVHGVRVEPTRSTTTCQTMHAMGLPPVDSLLQAGQSLERGNPVFVPVDVLCPPLARLLSVRDRLGVRNTGHTLAKLLDPVGVVPCLRLVSFTHPEFDELQHRLLERLGALAMVLRGAEGEAVASVRRMVRLDWVEAGATRTLVEADTVSMGQIVQLPPADDAVATAAWVLQALSGEQPVPDNIQRQSDQIVRALRQSRLRAAAARLL
jgi:anthranilate phosphoribosyltransferase